MLLVPIVSLFVYDVFFLLYFKDLFPAKHKHWLFYVSVIAVNLGAVLVSDIFNLHFIGVFLVMGSMILAFKLLFHMNGLQMVYAGSLYMFSLYSSRGIIVSIYALLLKESINHVLEQTAYYYTVLVLAVLTSILINIVVRQTIARDKDFKQLHNNRGQLKFVAIYQLILLFYLLLINNGRFLELVQPWFTALYLISCLLSKGVLLFVLNHAIKVSVLLEYELHTRQLQEHLERQVQHYRSYQKYTESFRAFKHDYKIMMATVKSLLNNNEKDKAVQLIDDIHDTMQKSVLIHKTYSDNIILDAILQDTANACEEKNIRFSAVLHLPSDSALSHLNIVRLSSNVLNNAIEACCKIPDVSQRFIEIRSSVNNDWVYVEIANSFNGEAKFENGELITSKQNKDFHGFGLKIVKEVVEGLGGLVLIDADRTQKIFTIKLHIPRH